MAGQVRPRGPYVAVHCTAARPLHQGHDVVERLRPDTGRAATPVPRTDQARVSVLSDSGGWGSGLPTTGATMDERYPPIAEHGLVGDLQTAALVSSRGVIDWFAAPDLTLPASSRRCSTSNAGVFPVGAGAARHQLQAALLPRHGGPGDPIHVAGRGGRSGRLHASRPDGYRHRPAHPGPFGAGRAGTVGFTLRCRPRFDYGRAEHELDLGPDGALFRAPASAPTCRAPSRWSATAGTSGAR